MLITRLLLTILDAWMRHSAPRRPARQGEDVVAAVFVFDKRAGDGIARRGSYKSLKLQVSFCFSLLGLTWAHSKRSGLCIHNDPSLGVGGGGTEARQVCVCVYVYVYTYDLY